MLRLFVALALPEWVKDDLERLQAGVPGARWVEREQMHLTLRFIGEVDRGTFRDVATMLSMVDAPPFDLNLEGIDTFGSRRKTSTLWAGVSKSPPLALLKGRVDAAVAKAGLGGDDRKFAPHVTLARFRAGAPPKLGLYVAANNLFRTQTFTVDSFVLFSSITRAEGAIYTEEAVYPLNGD